MISKSKVCLSFEVEKRLNCQEHYKRVFDEPDYKIHTTHLLLITKKGILTHPRLGVVVSKKTCKKSHDRVRIKRIIRESFRLQQLNLSPFDIIVMSKMKVAELNKVDLWSELDSLWVKLQKRFNMVV